MTKFVYACLALLLILSSLQFAEKKLSARAHVLVEQSSEEGSSILHRWQDWIQAAVDTHKNIVNPFGK